MGFKLSVLDSSIVLRIKDESLLPNWLEELSKYTIRLDHPTEYRLMKKIGEGSNSVVRLACRQIAGQIEEKEEDYLAIKSIVKSGLTTPLSL